METVQIDSKAAKRIQYTDDGVLGTVGAIWREILVWGTQNILDSML